MTNHKLKEFIDETTVEEIENCLKASINLTLLFVKKKFFNDIKADQWTYPNFSIDLFKWISKHFNTSLKQKWPEVLKGSIKELDSDIEELKEKIRYHERQQRLHRIKKRESMKEFELLTGKKLITRLKKIKKTN